MGVVRKGQQPLDLDSRSVPVLFFPVSFLLDPMELVASSELVNVLHLLLFLLSAFKDWLVHFIILLIYLRGAGLQITSQLVVILILPFH